MVDKETVFNLSNNIFTEIELSVLSKYWVHKSSNIVSRAKKINKFEILSRFEMLVQSLNRLPLKSAKMSNTS